MFLFFHFFFKWDNNLHTGSTIINSVSFFFIFSGPSHGTDLSWWLGSDLSLNQDINGET